MKSLFFLITTVLFTGCIGPGYNYFMVFDSVRQSTAAAYINALKKQKGMYIQERDETPQTICEYYPAGYGGFSSGCYYH
jgi:hypothetical protein